MITDVGESYSRYSIAIPTKIDQNTHGKENRTEGKEGKEERRKIERGLQRKIVK
jgi:hypothetical protein